MRGECPVFRSKKPKGTVVDILTGGLRVSVEVRSVLAIPMKPYVLYPLTCTSTLFALRLPCYQAQHQRAIFEPPWLKFAFGGKVRSISNLERQRTTDNAHLWHSCVLKLATDFEHFRPTQQCPQRNLQSTDQSAETSSRGARHATYSLARGCPTQRCLPLPKPMCIVMFGLFKMNLWGSSKMAGSLFAALYVMDIGIPVLTVCPWMTVSFDTVRAKPRYGLKSRTNSSMAAGMRLKSCLSCSCKSGCSDR